MRHVFPESSNTNEQGVALEVLDPTPQTAQTLFDLAEKSYPTGSPWSAGQFQENLQAPFMHYIGLFKKERLIGFAAFFILDKEAEVHHVSIHKEYQHQGLGRYLLEFILQSSLVADVEEVFLEVRVSNHPALALYQAVGFEPIAKRSAYYTHPVEDAWIMCYKKETAKEDSDGKKPPNKHAH